MSDVSLINPPSLGPATGFAHVAICDGWVWIGGQISSDNDGAVLYPGDMPAQFRCALHNVSTALEAAGCTSEDMVKLSYYVTDLPAYRASRREIGQAYRDIMGQRYPASSLFGVQGLYEPEALIEIECVAHRPAQRS